MSQPRHNQEEACSSVLQPAPGIALGAREAAVEGEPSKIRRLLKLLGPGLISGAADDDPATIGTCAQIGATLGFATLWTMLATLPLMTTAQFISAKIGQVSGRGLAGVIRDHYPRWLLYPVVVSLLFANTMNAGADLLAIAAAINLLVPISTTLLVAPIAVLLVGFQIWGSYRLIERTFKWLTLALLAYVAAGILARPDWWEVLRSTFVPTIRLDRQFLEALVAIAGTTFSPYIYFWQSNQEVEEQAALGRRRRWRRRGTTDAELRYAAWDVGFGMVSANLVTYFIILATGATLFRAGQRHIETAAQAAEALRPLAGNAASTLLATGLIGAGLLAVPVLTTSAAYALSEAFGWEYGLNRAPGRAPQFYAAIALATFMAAGMSYMGINPVAALFWTSVVYGFVAPPLLLILMLISGNRAIMGRWVNGFWTNLAGWVSVVLTFAALAGLVIMWLR